MGSKKRGAGGALDVLKAQHLDAGVALARRIAIKLARFKQVGATNFDQQIVDGTIGNLINAFLMQLVGSPSVRPMGGHLWAIGGMPVVTNGDGTVTPVKTAWSAKDTDIGPISCDIFPTTGMTTAGMHGVLLRATDDDTQTMVCLVSDSGGGGGGGAWPVDGIDGDVHIVSGGGNYLQGVGGSLPFINQYGIATDPDAARPNVFYTTREIWCNKLTIDAGVILCASNNIYCRQLVGGGTITRVFDVWYNCSHGVPDNGGTGGSHRPFGAAYSGGPWTFGGAGGLGTTPGSPGTGTAFMIPKMDGAFGIFGVGGAGGGSSAGAGGAGGVGTRDTSFRRQLFYDMQTTRLLSASGGGGAGAVGPQPGAKGGTSGAMLWVEAQDMSMWSGSLDASGSQGVDGDYAIGNGSSFAFNNGGGGGGGGGYIVLVTNTPGGSGLFKVGGGNGGLAGTGGGGMPGTNGQNGTTSVRY